MYVGTMEHAHMCAVVADSKRGKFGGRHMSSDADYRSFSWLD